MNKQNPWERPRCTPENTNKRPFSFGPGIAVYALVCLVALVVMSQLRGSPEQQAERAAEAERRIAEMKAEEERLRDPDYQPRLNDQLIYEVYEAGVELVTRQLKAPSTASFGPRGPRSVRQGASGYIAEGWVDAQNSFGAMIRTEWVCDIRRAGDQYRGNCTLFE